MSEFLKTDYRLMLWTDEIFVDPGGYITSSRERQIVGYCTIECLYSLWHLYFR